MSDECFQILKLDLGHWNCRYFIFDVITCYFHSRLKLRFQVFDLHPLHQFSLYLTLCDTQILINALGKRSSVETHPVVFKHSLLVVASSH
jgi:hypothetical protein